MRPKIILLFFISVLSLPCFSQEPALDSEKGYRMKKSTNDQRIFKNMDDKPNWKDWRKLNYRVYFRIVDAPTVEKDGVTYQLISIPGKNVPLSQEELKNFDNSKFPLSGSSINEKDYDMNFWIDSSAIEKYAGLEHFKYENDAFTGVLTAPFKLRLALGSSENTFIDGNFNVAPFFGWKFRLSKSKPHFVSPFVFSGITTLNYTSSDNSKISDPEIKESGSGITYGGGVAFRFGTVSPGIVLGFDHGFGNLGKGFEYNDKLWLSFSVNFEFFKPKELEQTKAKINK